MTLAEARLIAFAPTTDFAKAKHFFGEVLGLRQLSEDGFAVVFDTGGTILRVAKVESLSPAPFTILGWHVRDIGATVTELTAKGVVFKRYPGMQQDEQGVWMAPSGFRIAWFTDEDGNVLSLTQGPPRPQ
jgi:catechol 2,3-dioxygenase-like lactoylglutathione lyase family enzyme